MAGENDQILFTNMILDSLVKLQYILANIIVDMECKKYLNIGSVFQMVKTDSW